MQALARLFDRNRVAASAFRVVKGYDPDYDGDEDKPGEPDVDDGAQASNEATIFVYDVIGGWDWDGTGITAKRLCQQIAALDVETIHVRFNSPGGDVFEARAIKTALEQSSARVIAHVDSLAASAASFLMLAADEIEIAPGAFVMIHNPWGVSIGDSGEMRKTADLLDQVRDVIVDDYKGKTKMSKADLRAMMDAESWLSAEDAVAKGFCDRLMQKAPKAAAKAKAFDLSAFAHPPQTYGAQAAADEPALDGEAAEAAFKQLEADRARAEARLRLF